MSLDIELIVRYMLCICHREHDVYMLHFPIQLKFSPRNKPGFGMTDGEVVERLWSYLRRFARMTKEMRPAHRIDVLSDALFHYSRKSKENLGDLLTTLMSLLFIYLAIHICTEHLLPAQLEKATSILAQSRNDLQRLMQQAPGNV